ncbi:MAG TPA: twin-arginine translocation signal domain-containing protein, partial [Planctomycetaceae bacterium]|nr:twin-arginine translocation signal domain-containing protein [Planctomycetaceae bacterium]
MQSDRRHFLQAGLLGAAAAALPVEPAAASGAEVKPAGKVEPFELDEMTIADLQQAMKSGKESAHSLVKKYRTRIEAIDKQGPALNSIIEFNPDALEIA